MAVDPSEAQVLVVEDDPDNLMVTLELLGLAGVTRVQWVSSGAEAPGAAEKLGRVDLALLDPDLPDMDILQLVPLLRALPACAGARLVAVTAHVMTDEVAGARRAGFDALLGKPLDYDRFPGQIRAILGGTAVWSAG